MKFCIAIVMSKLTLHENIDASHKYTIAEKKPDTEVNII